MEVTELDKMIQDNTFRHNSDMANTPVNSVSTQINIVMFKILRKIHCFAWMISVPVVDFR